MKLYFFFINFFWSITCFGQIGSWQSHLPQTSAQDVIEVNDKMFCASEFGIFSVDKSDQSIVSFGTHNGLSEAGISAFDFDESSQTLIVAYTNSNIDLIKNGQVTNVPDLFNKTIVGDKQINNIVTENGIAYLATGFGVVVLDLLNNEIDDSYFLGPNGSNLLINDVAIWQSQIYAATGKGLLKAPLSGINLSDFRNWELDTVAGFTTIPFLDIELFKEQLYVTNQDVIFVNGSNDWEVFYSETNWKNKYLKSDNNELFFIQYLEESGNFIDRQIGIIDALGSISFVADNFFIDRPAACIRDENGQLWIADRFKGLSQSSGDSYINYAPNTPNGISSREMAYMDGSFYVTTSAIGISLNFAFSSPVIHRYTNGFWENFNEFNLPGLAGYRDLASIQPLPSENKILLSSLDNGILEWNLSDNSFEVFEKPENDDSEYRVASMDMDDFGNVWMANSFSPSSLVCRKPGGEYLFFSVPELTVSAVNDIVVDEFNQVWISTKENGIFVYDYNRTLEDQSDDNPNSSTGKPLRMSDSEGLGNLPSSSVVCMAEDKDGEIWIGTKAGIAIVFCPGSVFNRQCNAERICIPRSDTSTICDLLLENELITCITVDEADRKWIGTNNGVFLQSSNGEETIHYFNKDNSPLPSNAIRNIAIHPETGDVFIGTAKGLMSFRSDATNTQESSGDAYVYPNPVREDYHGPIAIKNLPNNASVKITDVGGFLVYETQATGGQAIWDGNLIGGGRAASGVYVVFAATKDGSEKAVTKFVLINN